MRTDCLEIVNKNGDVVIRMTTSDEGHPEISLLDANSKCPRVCLQVEEDRVSIAILVNDGTLKIGIGSDVTQGGGLTITDANNTRMAMVKVRHEGEEFVKYATLQ